MKSLKCSLATSLVIPTVTLILAEAKGLQYLHHHELQHIHLGSLHPLVPWWGHRWGHTGAFTCIGFCYRRGLLPVIMLQDLRKSEFYKAISLAYSWLQRETSFLHWRATMTDFLHYRWKHYLIFQNCKQASHCFGKRCLPIFKALCNIDILSKVVQKKDQPMPQLVLSAKVAEPHTELFPNSSLNVLSFLNKTIGFFPLVIVNTV